MGSNVLRSIKFQIKEILVDNRVSMKRPTLYKQKKICLKLLGSQVKITG